MRRASRLGLCSRLWAATHATAAPAAVRAMLLAVVGAGALTIGHATEAAPRCDKPVYLTFDTGHMGVAPLVAQVLQRHGVKVTFFLASERTLTGGTTLDEQWTPWWRERVAEGHAFGSHTWDHDVWLADVGTHGAAARFRFRPTQGPQSGKVRELDEAAYCAELKRPAAHWKAMTGAAMAPIFRAPGGKTSPALLAAASRCGFSHVGWTDAGFLGDELPSDRFPNEQLLQKALRDVRPGDILLAHLGIWSRRDAWAPAVLEPLITGLKSRGLCFATLRDHPQLGAAARKAL